VTLIRTRPVAGDDPASTYRHAGPPPAPGSRPLSACPGNSAGVPSRQGRASWSPRSVLVFMCPSCIP